MGTLLDILRFELALHARSALSWAVVAGYGAIHALAIAGIGIHLGDNQLTYLNGATAIVQTQLVLSAFGMVPAIYFVVSAATRDDERGTAPLVFATPVDKWTLLGGRLTAGTLWAIFAAILGTIGTFAGTRLPWLDQDRVGPFAWEPYAESFGLIALPNAMVFCGLFFSLALTARSMALSFASALAVLVLEVVLQNAARPPIPPWLSLLDPFGGLAVAEASRYWTVADLNTRVPLAGLPMNRLVWVGAALLGVIGAVSRYRLEWPTESPRRMWLGRTAFTVIRTRARASGTHGAPTRRARSALWSQLGVDVRCVVVSPFFWLVMALAVLTSLSDVQSRLSLLGDLPLHPITSQLVGVSRYSLLQFVLLLLVYYSAELVHRERVVRVADLVASTPCPPWVMVVSKGAALVVVVTTVLLSTLAVRIVRQVGAGIPHLELGIHLQDLFLVNGFYFFMLAALAVVVQVLSAGRWSGMLLLVGVFAGLVSLEPLGWEHVLYSFRVPAVPYSDFSGYGPYRAATWSFIGYGAAWSIVLLVAAHLWYCHGSNTRWRERMAVLRGRATTRTGFVALAAMVSWLTTGGWIYYNTNVLNRYETAAHKEELSAAYERAYGRWEGADAPSFADIVMDVDIHPHEHRLDARGTATLRNNKSRPIHEFVMSMEPGTQVRALVVDGARVVERDVGQGFYRFVTAAPLAPGATTTVSWNVGRSRVGFVNGRPDLSVIENGTFVEGPSVMPMPGFDEERRLVDPMVRRRHQLPQRLPLPTLGEASALDDLRFGIDAPATFRVVVSTSADQTAVAPGVLRQVWESGGRRFFEYVAEQPTWPVLAFLSARYAVARDSWNGVAIEVYHDATHPWNVGTMTSSAKKALAYFSREFGAYPFSQFRLAEYPRYRSAARAFPGTLAYSESAGFLADLGGWASLDYTTIHELAHQWWGMRAPGARMQGREVLNETLAQYSTLMTFREYEDPVWLRRLVASTLDDYLRLRRQDPLGERPVMLTEDQGNISYNKGALVMFALQEAMGAEPLHRALRRFLARFDGMSAPFATSRDLVDEIRAVAGPEHQALVTELFEQIVLYDLRVDRARVEPAGEAFDLTVDVSAHRFEATASGVETEVPLSATFDFVVFPETDGELITRSPLLVSRQQLRSGPQTLRLRVQSRPAAVAVDPFHLRIDRAPENNTLILRESDFSR